MPKFTDVYDDEDYSDGDLDVMHVKDPYNNAAHSVPTTLNDPQAKITEYSIREYGRYPSVNMRNLSLSPPVFETRIYIDEAKGLYGVGLGGSQKDSEKYAVEQLSRMIDLFSSTSHLSHQAQAIQVPQSNRQEASIKTLLNTNGEIYLSHDLNAYRNEAWHENPKVHVNSIFQKHLKRGPDVQTKQNESGQFLTIVTLQDNHKVIYGRGKAPNVKESTRFAALDFLQKYYDLDSPKSSILQTEAPKHMSQQPQNNYINYDQHQYSKEPWADAPKAELHNIFISRFKRPPFYDSKSDDGKGWYSSVEYDASKGLVGYGKGTTKADSTKNAAVDLLLKLGFSMPSVPPSFAAEALKADLIVKIAKPAPIDKKSPIMCKKTSNVTKDLFQSPKIAPEPALSSNMSSQPLRDAGTDADFIKFTADEFKLAYPLINVWSVGPPHSPEWYCHIQMKTPRGLIEAITAPEVQKKKALADIMVLFSEKLQKAEPQVWSKFKSSGDGLATGKYAKIRGDDDLALYRNMKNAVSLEKSLEITPVDWEHAEFALTVSSKSLPELEKLFQGKDAPVSLASDLKAYHSAKSILPFNLPLNIPFNKPLASSVKFNLHEKCHAHLISTYTPGEALMEICRLKFDQLPGHYLIVAGNSFQSKVFAEHVAKYLEEDLGGHVGYYVSSKDNLPASSGPSLIFAPPVASLKLLNQMPFSGAIINVALTVNDEFSLLALSEAKSKLAQNHIANLFVVHSYTDSHKVLEYMKGAECAIYDIRDKISSPKVEFIPVDSQQVQEWMVVRPKVPEISPISDVIAQIASADESTLVVLSSWECVMQLQKYMVYEDPKRIGYADRSKFEIFGLHEGLQPLEWISFSSRLSQSPDLGVRRIILTTQVIFGLPLSFLTHTIIHAGSTMNFSGLENGLIFTSKWEHELFAASARGRYIVLLNQIIWQKFVSQVPAPKFGPEEFSMVCRSFSSVKQAEAVELLENVPWSDIDLRIAERYLNEKSLLYDSGEPTITGLYLWENFSSQCGLSLKSAKTLYFGVLFCALDSILTCVCIHELYGAEGLTVALAPIKAEVSEYSDHVANLIRFNEWKNSRASFFSEKQELDYCRQKGIDLQRLQRVEHFRSQLYQRLGAVFRFLSEFVATGLGKNTLEVVNENNSKLWLIRGIIGASVANSKNVALVSSTVRPLDFYTVRGEHVCVVPSSVIHNYDRRRNYSATTSDACFAYYFEKLESGLLHALTKIPAMALLLFECHNNGFIMSELDKPDQLLRNIDASGQALNWCSDWISFNSRDSAMLRRMQVYLFLGIEWISAVALGLEKRPPSALMQRVNFINRMLDMTVELVGGHAKYE